MRPSPLNLDFKTGGRPMELSLYKNSDLLSFYPSYIVSQLETMGTCQSFLETNVAKYQF